ncbi:MAG: hypothetical protein CTY37_05320 [Methylotenera sp.]|nr:MAG: hypothetical protein CTY37_05320 [Methylotenera sp.]
MTRFKQLMINAVLGFVVFVALAMYLHVAVAATVWTEQTGQYYKYDKTPKNLTDASWDYALITDYETVNDTWVKQDGIFMQCLSSGGAKRYYQQGSDCYTGKLKVIAAPTSLTPTSDAIACADENRMCTIPSGLNAVVWYGIADKWLLKENLSGTIECNNAYFGKDPAVGSAKKCLYKSSTNTVTPPIIAPIKPPVSPPFIDTGECQAFLCADEKFGLVFDLTKNTVLTCPRVHITRDQQAQIYEGLQAGVASCK